MEDEAERAELARGGDALERDVHAPDPPPPADRVGEEECALAGDGCGERVAGGEAERRLERLDLAAQTYRQHPVDLLECTLDGGHLAGQPEPPRGEQAEHDRDGLVAGQHQRRQLVAGTHPVAAGETALTLDRNPELLERRDVAPDGPDVDAEPLGQLAPGRNRAGLERLEQLEQAKRGRGHRSQSSSS